MPVQASASIRLLLLKAACIRWLLEDGLATDRRKDNLQSMFVESDIEHMSVAERFQAMEVIWGSFLKSPEDVSSPSWHGEVLSKRLARVEAGQGKFLTLEELKERLGLSRS